MTEADPGGRTGAHERQSYVRHELRSPLAPMYPALSMLLDGSAGELTPKQRGYLEIIERNAERLERYIAGATESGWLDCAGEAIQPAAVPLGEALEEVLAMRRLGGQPGPLIEVDRSPGPRAVAWADREQVRQIVANLVGNAAQSSATSGVIHIRVSASADQQTVSLEVRDEGVGIPADELPHVFDFGYRGVSARVAAPPGLGIGLWVCRELVGRSGGSIALRSEVGAGTTVTVTLPAAAEDAAH
jgi:two-component system, OmpR family, phosphate regulon sensor histidine kinase PhoR